MFPERHVFVSFQEDEVCDRPRFLPLYEQDLPGRKVVLSQCQPAKAKFTKGIHSITPKVLAENNTETGHEKCWPDICSLPHGQCMLCAPQENSHMNRNRIILPQTSSLLQYSAAIALPFVSCLSAQDQHQDYNRQLVSMRPVFLFFVPEKPWVFIKNRKGGWGHS